MSFDLVIFDCDGVLIDSETISASMLIDTLADHGVSVDAPYVAEHFLGRSYPTVMKQIRTAFGITLSQNFEDEYRARLMAAFEPGLQIMAGVRDVVDQLGVPACVATSSSPKRVARSLQLVGLDHTFAGRVFTASEVANGKPAPDLFLHVAAHMGHHPNRCLVIEDSRNGILAAKAAGMTVWRFTGGSHIAPADRIGPTSQLADLTFDDFVQFFDHATDLKKVAVL
ncbi:MAG: HAD family hydrolase [Deltaproteobacteria bacterium]